MTGAKLMTEALQRAHRARPRPPAARARALSQRRRGQGAGAVRSPHPGQRRAAGRLLRLSGQAEPAFTRTAPSCTCSAASSRTPKPRCRRWWTSSARRRPTSPATARSPRIVTGKPTPENLATCVAAVLPEGAVIVDESVSYGRGFFRNTHAAAPHDWLQIMGGAIGAGIPLAVGSAIGLRAIGADERRVLALQADGSAMYTRARPVDAGAREAAGDHHHPVQPQVSDPDRRIFLGRRQSRPHRDEHARSRQPRHRLGQAGARPRRRGRAGRHAGSLRRPDGAIVQAARVRS